MIWNKKVIFSFCDSTNENIVRQVPHSLQYLSALSLLRHLYVLPMDGNTYRWISYERMDFVWTFHSGHEKRSRDLNWWCEFITAQKSYRIIELASSGLSTRYDCRTQFFALEYVIMSLKDISWLLFFRECCNWSWRLLWLNRIHQNEQSYTTVVSCKWALTCHMIPFIIKPSLVAILLELVSLSHEGP